MNESTHLFTPPESGADLQAPGFDLHGHFLENDPDGYMESTVKSCRDFSSSRNTLVPILPLALKLEGRPYTLTNHFPMEPIFRVRVPRRSLWKCGRQVAKSTSLSADAVLRALLTPYLKTLMITPRFQQIRWLSNNYVRPFIETSPVRHMMIGEHMDNQILQRSFKNGSILFFTFAFLSADRIRGYAVDKIMYDEVQDLDNTFLPIIRECITASPLAIQQYSGTPKTVDNTIEGLWQESSQAEWVSKCDCGHWNTASAQADLIKMIGRKGVVCSKCDKLLNVRLGHWKHLNEERSVTFPGYHIPQVILPLHNEDEDKWGELVAKRDGAGNYTETKFMNEILGESCDVGVKLVSLQDLKAVCTLDWDNDMRQAAFNSRDYPIRAMGVDWGGGGEEQISTTAAAVVGFHMHTKRWHVLYGERIHVSAGAFEEVRRLLYIAKQFSVDWLAHDYGGSGSVREALLVQAGFDVTKIIPFLYTGTSKNIVTHHSPTDQSSRHYYSLAKSSSLVLTCTAIKLGMINFPRYKSMEHLLNDFIALYEDRTEGSRGHDIYLIRRAASLMDDFAHAVNYACCAVWHVTGNFPNLAKKATLKYEIPENVAKEEL